MSAASIQSLPAHFGVFDPLTGSSERCKANAQHLRDATYAQSSRAQLAGTVSPIRITGEHLPPSTTHVLVCIKSAPGQLNYNRAADYDIQLWFDAAKGLLLVNPSDIVTGSELRLWLTEETNPDAVIRVGLDFCFSGRFLGEHYAKTGSTDVTHVAEF
ncbi:hypothetical protein FRB98_000402 [Tulasnella sp. 332]|nr:hypothetical protein FRB98_000402 [Tulasnella sp. 332]